MSLCQVEAKVNFKKLMLLKFKLRLEDTKQEKKYKKLKMER